MFDSRGVDHKGAAEFVLAQDLGPEDLVLAMDTQQQSYYLGSRMDYYLLSLNETWNSTFLRDGRMVSLYSGTPQISTGKELATVLNAPEDRQVLIVGSGELAKNPSRYLGDGILETMREFRFMEVYEGRDGATKVWRAIQRSK